MDHPDARGLALRHLEELLQRPGAVTGDVHEVAVVDADLTHPADGPGIGVRFRWRSDPTTYCVVLPVSTADDGTIHRRPGEMSWPGWDPTDVAAWAEEAAFLVVEELETGLVRRGRRTHEQLRDGSEVVHLDVTAGVAVRPAGFCVGALWLGEASDRGDHLRRAGFNTSAPLAALTDGRLLSWRHAYVDDAAGEPYVGTAAIAWQSTATAGAGGAVRLVTLQRRPDRPTSVAEALLFHVLRDARDHGAATALADDDVARAHPQALAAAGFRPAPTGGGLLLPLADLRWPDLSV